MILVYPDSKLRKKTSQITRIDDSLKKTLGQLEKDLLGSDLGVGLAAPQIGQAIRVFVVKMGCSHDRVHDKCDCPVEFFINPKIIDTFGQDRVYPQMMDEDGNREDFLEGCLSLPDIYGTVKRWLKIRVSYQVIEKDKLIAKQEILEAPKSLVFQHELDHLDGVLFIDHVKEDGGKLYIQRDGQLEKIDIQEIENVLRVGK